MAVELLFFFLNAEYKSTVEQKEAEIERVKKEHREEVRQLKFESEQVIEAERRKAKSELTDQRIALEKVKREELEKQKEDLKMKHEIDISKVSNIYHWNLKALS